MTTNNISKKRKFVADGVFYAELNEVSILPDGIIRAQVQGICPAHGGLWATPAVQVPNT